MTSKTEIIRVQVHQDEGESPGRPLGGIGFKNLVIIKDQSLPEGL